MWNAVLLCKSQVKLVNIRNDDIADGNPKLTLGLIWTIILHFQVSYSVSVEFPYHLPPPPGLQISLINHFSLGQSLVQFILWVSWVISILCFTIKHQRGRFCFKPVSASCNNMHFFFNQEYPLWSTTAVVECSNEAVCLILSTNLFSVLGAMRYWESLI